MVMERSVVVIMMMLRWIVRWIVSRSTAAGGETVSATRRRVGAWPAEASNPEIARRSAWLAFSRVLDRSKPKAPHETNT